MRKTDAEDILRAAFGPGDLKNKLNEILSKKDSTEYPVIPELDESDGDELLDWMTDMMVDEEEPEGGWDDDDEFEALDEGMKDEDE